MNLSRLNKVFQKAFSNCPQVDIDTDKETLESWDSVGHLVLVLELEKEYQTRFQLQEIEEMRSVKEILRVLNERSISP